MDKKLSSRYVYSLLTVLFLFSFLALGGCGSESSEQQAGVGAGDSGSGKTEPAQASRSSDDEEGPVNGGRIVFGSIGEPTNLIPFLATDAGSHEIAAFIFAGPLKYDKDFNIVPDLAEKFEVLDDGKLLRFTLRKGVTWEDGVELTTDDVKFTYDLMVDPNTPTAYAGDYLTVKELRIVDRYTFEAVYDKPFARSLITWMHGIMPRHLLEGQNLLETSFSRNPVGLGPYRLKEWKAGSHLILEASDTYFKGRPPLDEIVYRLIPDIATSFLELKAGNLDFMGLTPQQYLHQTKGAKWEEDWNKFKYIAMGYQFMAYNMNREPFNDRRVRQALAHAIDKEAIIKGVLLGMGHSTIGPYLPGSWVYNEKIKDYPYDPAKAKAMLAEAGWEDRDGDGLLDKDGRSFEFTLMTNQGNDQRVKVATIIQALFKQIGIGIRIRTVEWAAFNKEFLDKRQYDAVILSFNILADPDSYDVWHSSKDFEGGLNFVGFRNEEADRMLEAGRSSLDRAVRKKAYDRLQEILHEEQPYCFLYVPYSLPIIHARFRGPEPAPAGIRYNQEEWWVPKRLQRFTREQ